MSIILAYIQIFEAFPYQASFFIHLFICLFF